MAQRTSIVNAHKASQFDVALEGYTDYLAHHPTDAGIWTNLGALYRSMGKHQMARVAQARAYALAPSDKGILNNYANILSDLGDYEFSIELRQKSLAMDASHVMHHAMIGRCYRGMGDYDTAIQYLAPKVDEFPEETEIQLQLAFAQLGAGHYGAAFRSYDARWETDELDPPDVPFARWKEGMAIDGKSILILPEQGFGDMVLLARFIPLIAEMGAKVRLVAKKPLLRLLDGIEGVSWIGPNATKEDPIDLWISLMDLPKLVYGADEHGIAPAPTVLSLPTDSVARAKRITANHHDMFKVGVVWSGSATYKGNSFRSFTHREFLPMAEIPNVQLFSLYKGPFLEALKKDGSGALIIDTASTDRDFADCAATMQEMDLVITSDTATAHIAGSLGVPTWVMLHWDSFWVYGHEGDTTPWYPSMRLFQAARATRLAKRIQRGDGCTYERAKVANVVVEKTALMATADAQITPSSELDALWEELYQINSDLWVIEDDIRDCEMAKDFGEEFIRLARAVYITNDRRADNINEARRLLRKEIRKLSTRLKDNRSRSRGPIVRQLHEAQRMLSPLYTYSSQAGQDLVVDRVMQNKRGGTFVDVGGYDGVTGSNTYFLETMRGWTGALVEPVRAQISKAEKWRTCPCLEVAIASQKGSYDKGLLKTVRDDKRHKEKTVKVKTMTLADVLHQMNLVNPDFISLDIEGGELTCLETFPFADHDVAVWAIENNAGTPEIKNIMEAQGYDLIEFCGPDEVYFKRSP
ncbi:Protein FlbA [Nymphon striatum]|nr:Protein FlbA [Nymphon striatum]